MLPVFVQSIGKTNRTKGSNFNTKGDKTMARCEDYPCCGHENGCCPDFDESGKQLNMKCTCGATVPIDSHYSICDACLNQMDAEEGIFDCEYEDYDEWSEDWNNPPW